MQYYLQKFHDKSKYVSTTQGKTTQCPQGYFLTYTEQVAFKRQDTES